MHTSCPAAGAWAGFSGQRAGGSYIRDKTSTIRDVDRVARHFLPHSASSLASEAEGKRWDGEDRHPIITHRPTRTGGDAQQRQRPCSLSSAFPSLFPFLTSSPLSCMHACAHACVHICLLVCQRPPDDRSGLGTWFFVMVDHWTDRRTDRRTRILRNTAFNFDSPYPDTLIYTYTRTRTLHTLHVYAHCLPPPVRAWSGSPWVYGNVCAGSVGR